MLVSDSAGLAAQRPHPAMTTAIAGPSAPIVAQVNDKGIPFVPLRILAEKRLREGRPRAPIALGSIARRWMS